jgi:ribose transport system permease protein
MRPAARPPILGTDRVRSLGILLPFILLFATLSIASSHFLTRVNLLEILDQQASTLIVAAAGTLVLVGGGIDISVGSTYALSGVVSAQLALHTNALFAIVIGIAVGAVVGAVNGFVITVFRINSMIATLAMSFVVGGIATLISNGSLIVLYDKHGFGDLARSTFLDAKTSVWVMAVPVVALGFLLSRAKVGRYMYAVGGNTHAARLAGVRVDGIRILTFVLSGTAAGLAGVVDTSRVLSAASSSSDTSTFAFTVLAGIVVGGTSILGGDGAVWRSVVGVLFIALVGNGYILLGLNVLYQQVTLGVLMIGAVGLDVWSRRRRV